MDGSDEKEGCNVMKTSCSGFLCQNGHCLARKEWECDNKDDCGDNSDEQHCCKLFLILETLKLAIKQIIFQLESVN